MDIAHNAATPKFAPRDRDFTSEWLMQRRQYVKHCAAA